MKTLKLFTVVPLGLTISLLLTHASLAEIPPLQINSSLKPDPLIVKGESGGSIASNCGNISSQPSQVIQVTESVPYLRLTVETVETQGKPSLLVDGPGGRFCVLPDNYNGSKAEFSGYWQSGKYSIHVGELSKIKYNYTLYISQQKQPK
ncbi:hypothetical protein MEO40_12720 [Dolichospermum sp. ST_sed1]|nr:hypothetical protein [Dolichospermum sp. ST_sed1]MDD1424816.1 hypothetical protein [Dolichospermum sp. ST_sed9]MDD1431316.1 hypothetical protein [Dolichospermum sp. ST_sed6]MDD1440722.1 hypothetical protein [Dolichospermum sp. ST_sed3]MDD1445551.1 hypothetical protein [Dolichospermum sp. ST_sed8]MDD1454862.1 hypothetical protein [Dolichospermum sp. ST_sed7]MDD1460711.1 hypothetical protein [Dolichospermum sp. ST_sed2]MDD1464007.1 hypothetical protein [Dolichospermum sp. ST_sed5]MDD147095